MATTERSILDMEFSERLVALRKQRQLTQQALADLVGVHAIQIHRYESGASQPSLEVIKKLAVALSVTADTLLFEKDERGPEEDLRLQFEAVARLDPAEKTLVREVVESIIVRHDARRLFARTGAEEASP